MPLEKSILIFKIYEGVFKTIDGYKTPFKIKRKSICKKNMCHLSDKYEKLQNKLTYTVFPR